MAQDQAELVAGYGRALVSAAEAEQALDTVADELFRLARTIEATPELADRLTNPGIGVAARTALVEQLLSGKAHPATTAAVLMVVQAGRARYLSAIADEVARLSAEARSRTLAEVRSAVELDAPQRERLAAALSAATGQEVELKVVVDEHVVGGLVAKVGDTVIDGSVARRLADVRTRLTG
jgi:F-type H+-transporting ATPase subunit delta